MIQICTHGLFGGIKPFIFTVDTTKAGSDDDTFILPINLGTTNVYVNWGDGNTDTYVTAGNKTHVYDNPGVYTIKIKGEWTGLKFANIGDRLKIIDIIQWGGIIYKSFHQAYLGCENLDFTTIDEPNFVIGVGGTDNRMDSAFYQTKYNKSIGWIPPGIIAFFQTWFQVSELNQDLGSLNLSSVASTGGANGAMTDILTSTGLSTANKDATLNGWWAQAPNIPSNVTPTITGGGARSSASDAAVAGLTSAPYNWIITL
jgi:hypothetical protein